MAGSGDPPLSIARHRAVQVDPIASGPARAKRRADHAATRCVHAHQPDVRLAERVFNHAIFGQDQGRAGRALGADGGVPGTVHSVQPFGDPRHHAVLEAGRRLAQAYAPKPRIELPEGSSLGTDGPVDHGEQIGGECGVGLEAEEHITTARPGRIKVRLLRVSERLDAMHRARDAAVRAQRATGTALILAKDRVVEDAFRETDVRLVSMSATGRRVISTAFRAGWAAGERVNLNRPVPGDAQRRLA